jgi:KDO2-lipid IV(A) lauroyltransferase
MATKLRRFYRRWPPLRRAVRRRKQSATYWMVRFALWLPRRVTLPRALEIADRAGDLAYRLLPATRRLALEHIELALGNELSAAERARIVQASFRNQARSLCELAHFESIRARLDQYVEVEGWEHSERALAGGRGAVAVTGHVGNWELLAATFALRGVAVGAVARRISEPRLNRLLVDFRAASGVETILRESAAATRQILRILNQGGVLALLIDQDTMAPSVSVPFFGRMARTPAAAAALAVRRDLPAIPVFAHRRLEGGHRMTVLPPVDPPRSGDRVADVRTMTRRFNEILEQRIRSHPAEWVWWHRRWRRAPVARLDLDAGLG